MQSSKQQAKFFSEDLIYRSARDGKAQVGLVVSGYDSDSEDEDSEAGSNSGRCKVAAGHAKVAWYPTGKTQVIDENNVKLLDRALLPGDVIQYTGQSRQQQQMGFVADGVVRLDLRILGTDQVIRNVMWSELHPVSPVDDQVIILFNNWIGYVVENTFKVTLETADGSVLTMSDYDFLLLEDISTERHDRCHFEEFPFVGQKVIARKKHLRYASWISRTRTSHIYCNADFPANFKILMTVRNVKLDQLDVKWMYCVSEDKVTCSAHSSPLEPPSDLISGPDLESVHQLNYFGKNSLQTGDRAYYVVKKDDDFFTYRDWQHAFADDDSQSESEENQSGEQKVPPDSAASRVRSYACMPRKREVSVSVKRIRKKRLRPAKRLDIRSRNASLTPGSRVAVEVISTETLVQIVWQDGSESSDIPSNHFYPVQHVDSHEFFPGDFIVENKNEFSYNTYGVVQKVDHSGRTAVVQWLEYNPNDHPKRLEVESVSVYDIKDHPDFQFRPGSCVIRVQSGSSVNFQAISCVGQVIRVHTSGQLECVWVNGSKELVHPQDLFHIGEYDSDDLWADSENEDGGDEEEDAAASTTNEEASKEELLSQLMETINDLESWLQNHETVNNRNVHHPMRMVLNMCKQMREVSQFGEMTFSLNELKSLLDTTKPPESPSEITWARLANRVKGFLNVAPMSQEAGDKAENVSGHRDESSKTESPNSKKTTASLETLRRIKTHLFPLCNSLSVSGDQKDVPVSACSSDTPDAAAESSDEPIGNFKMEESVPDCHRYKLSVHQPHNPKLFCSKVRQEISLLKSSLPDDIFVKAYEDRMDLFSFMIRGPKATPYEDGLFLFDTQLPADYPTHPPAVHYISFCTDRLNPNLYENGKVCVSLLGTWVGKGSEVWFPGSSNLLQVMVSIQGLILVPEPYFNEAGYLRQKGTDEGQENSRLYNEMAVVKVVQSLTKMLTLPPAAFRSEVVNHIRETGPLLTERLSRWIQLSEEVNAGVSSVPREEVALTTEFPLLPASQGFCLSLKKALTAFQNNMSKN